MTSLRSGLSGCVPAWCLLVITAVAAPQPGTAPPPPQGSPGAEEPRDPHALAKYLNARSEAAHDRRDWTEAESLDYRALAAYEAIGDKAGQSLLLERMTWLPSKAPDENLLLLERAIELAREAGSREAEGRALHRKSDHLFNRGDYARAADSEDQALGALEAHGDPALIARALLSRGRLHRMHGQVPQAFDAYDRAVALAQASGNYVVVARSLDSKASALSQAGRSEEALAAQQLAVEAARKSGDRWSIANCLGGLAHQLNSARRYAEALAVIEEALPLAEIDDFLLAGKYQLRAQALSALGRDDEAIEAAGRAIELGKHASTLQRRAEQHDARAQALERTGRLAEALADARSSIEILESLRARLVPRDFMKRGFGDRVQATFAYTIRLLDRLGRPGEAFEVAERARARAFLDLLASRESELAGERSTAANAPPAASSSPPASGAPSRPPDGMQFLAMRGRRTNTDAPAGAARDISLDSFVSVAPPAASELGATALRLNTTILSYWVGPEETIVWVVGRDGVVRSARVTITEQRLTDLIQSTWALSGATARGGADWVPLTRGTHSLAAGRSTLDAFADLYALLIAPVRQWLPASRGSLVTVVPHGPLFRLSFAALRARSMRYLVEDYRLHYAPSVSVLGFTGRRAVARAPGEHGRVLVVANPAIPPELASEADLPPLAGATAEGKAISREMSDVMLLTGPEARESRVRSLSGASRVLHFATHGVVWDDRPFESFLALAQGTGEAEDDGRLTTEEIYGLDLHADLVVLSACRTAGGTVTGDGIVGLTRAFFYAGTPSVVATLWDLPDESARLMLPRFYGSWRKTGDKAGALRSAQLSLLSALRARRVSIDTPAGRFTLPEHPALWANLALIGEP